MIDCAYVHIEDIDVGIAQHLLVAFAAARDVRGVTERIGDGLVA
jgi:hypothetical protein